MTIEMIVMTAASAALALMIMGDISSAVLDQTTTTMDSMMDAPTDGTAPHVVTLDGYRPSVRID